MGNTKITLLVVKYYSYNSNLLISNSNGMIINKCTVFGTCISNTDYKISFITLSNNITQLMVMMMRYPDNQNIRIKNSPFALCNYYM